MSYLLIHILAFVVGAAVAGFIIGWLVHKTLTTNTQLLSRFNALEDDHNTKLDGLHERLNSLHTHCHKQPQQKPIVEKQPVSVPAQQPKPSKDKLTRIYGIGSILEKVLNEEGIHTFEDVANISNERTLELDDKIFIPGRIQRDGWREQAQQLAQGRNAKK